jgi:soluble lytic murein transglycosylase-like protein
MQRAAWIAALIAAASSPPVLADVHAWIGERGTLVLSNLQGAREPEAVLVLAEPGRAASGSPAPVALARPVTRAAERYRDEVEQAARESGLDGALLHAVIAVESGHLAHAVSPKGALGLMQLMPLTARRFGVANAYDALQNVRGGARYLRYLLDSFGGDLALALAAYNAGEHTVLRYGRRVPPFRETIDYVRKVQDRYEALRATGWPPG